MCFLVLEGSRQIVHNGRDNTTCNKFAPSRESADGSLLAGHTSYASATVNPWIIDVDCSRHSVFLLALVGGGPRVVVSYAAFHARVRGSVPGLGGLKETKCFFPIHV